MSVLTSARLVAIDKATGGVRPIAVGETLRRLEAKLLHKENVASATEYFGNLKVGVKVPESTETVGRRVKQWMKETAAN